MLANAQGLGEGEKPEWVYKLSAGQLFNSALLTVYKRTCLSSANVKERFKALDYICF